jgi:hypothetical protein
MRLEARGDAHNFGRRVAMRGGRIVKPRTLAWERLLLSAKSPLRRALLDAARDADVPDAFAFLPDLAFHAAQDGVGGEVDPIDLTPLPAMTAARRRSLAIVLGRSLALWSWLGVSDLHWENLALGAAADGAIVLAPLDVEMILSDLELPAETHLLPDADPEYADTYRHACGARRALAYLGKPVRAEDVAAIAAGYAETLAILDAHAKAIAEAVASVAELREAPIRVSLRGTDEYVRARVGPVWPPLLDAESEQLARGDIPYFFRLYGQPGIRWYTEASLTRTGVLPLRGDVPRLAPLLPVGRALRGRSRGALREKGLLTVIGAFDDGSASGRHEAGGLEITFGKRSLRVRDGGDLDIECPRDLRAVVVRVYSPCRCGEVRAVLVPEVTACSAPREVISAARDRGRPRRRV